MENSRHVVPSVFRIYLRSYQEHEELGLLVKLGKETEGAHLFLSGQSGRCK